jgi:hypothetical protein
MKSHEVKEPPGYEAAKVLSRTVQTRMMMTMIGFQLLD